MSAAMGLLRHECGQMLQMDQNSAKTSRKERKKDDCDILFAGFMKMDVEK